MQFLQLLDLGKLHPFTLQVYIKLSLLMNQQIELLWPKYGFPTRKVKSKIKIS